MQPNPKSYDHTFNRMSTFSTIYNEICDEIEFQSWFHITIQFNGGKLKKNLTQGFNNTNYLSFYALDIPLCSLSTCSTNATGSRNPLLHFGQTSTVTFITPFFSWIICTWSINAATLENFILQIGHCSTWPLLLEPPLGPTLLSSLIIRDETALSKLVVQLDDEEEEDTGAWVVRCGCGFCFWLLFENPQNEKVGSGFLGPGQPWSRPNLCLRQWSMVQSRHLIVLENVRTSLQPRTGHFFFLITFS